MNDQPQPPLGPDEGVEPRARQVSRAICAKCKQGIWWDGGSALWCQNKECSNAGVVFWNPDLKLQLECS